MAKFCLHLHSFTALAAILFLNHYTILSDSITLKSDVRALRSIRQSIDPNTLSSSTFMHTWDFRIDPCVFPGKYFLGVLCTLPQDNSSNRVTEINLEGDGLEGFISPIIGTLSELTLLNLGKNQFRGPIPSSIINATQINTLVLYENFLSGSIPSGIGKLRRLEFLDLSQNRLTGSVPVALTNIRSLTHLGLSNNEFKGRIPDMTPLWKLNTLDLSRNRLSGNLPRFPRGLKSLFLSNNILFGGISPLDNLKHLMQLDLSSNRLSGMISYKVLALPEIHRINLSKNRFSYIQVRPMMNKLSQLETLDLNKNRIRGQLPLNLITLRNLTSVDLGYNLFTGKIPVEYGQKVAKELWTTLFLNNNYLEGEVPAGLRNISIRGSLAQNCIKCNREIPICRGGQKSAAQCVGFN